VAELCDRQHYFVVLFAFAVVFLLIQVPYLFVADSDSALYVVVAMNVAGSAAFAVRERRRPLDLYPAGLEGVEFGVEIGFGLWCRRRIRSTNRSAPARGTG